MWPQFPTLPPLEKKSYTIHLWCTYVYSNLHACEWICVPCICKRNSTNSFCSIGESATTFFARGPTCRRGIRSYSGGRGDAYAQENLFQRASSQGWWNNTRTCQSALHRDQWDIWEWSSWWHLNDCITRNTHIPISTSKKTIIWSTILCSAASLHMYVYLTTEFYCVLFITRSWHYVTSHDTQNPSDQACVPVLERSFEGMTTCIVFSID